eukprot:1934883-Rhodomonas_salina.2
MTSHICAEPGREGGRRGRREARAGASYALAPALCDAVCVCVCVCVCLCRHAHMSMHAMCLGRYVCRCVSRHVSQYVSRHVSRRVHTRMYDATRRHAPRSIRRSAPTQTYREMLGMRTPVHYAYTRVHLICRGLSERAMQSGVRPAEGSAEVPKGVSRNLGYAISTLNDQSYATDSETEEQ